MVTILLLLKPAAPNLLPCPSLFLVEITTQHHLDGADAPGGHQAVVLCTELCFDPKPSSAAAGAPNSSRTAVSSPCAAEVATSSLSRFRAHFDFDLMPTALARVSAPSDCATSDTHLFVCVHGMNGCQYDLRQLQLELDALIPQARFLMTACNVGLTHESCVLQATRLELELTSCLAKLRPARVSFIGHSLGTIVIRELLSRDHIRSLFVTTSDDSPISMGMPSKTAQAPTSRAGNPATHGKPFLHTFISLAGPHLGIVGIKPVVSTGLWLMRVWHRSKSILELELRDRGPVPTGRSSEGPTGTTTAVGSQPTSSVSVKSPNVDAGGLLRRLSTDGGLALFANIVLVASQDDGYVPSHSALLLSSSSSVTGDAKQPTTTAGSAQQLQQALCGDMLQQLQRKNDGRRSRCFRLQVRLRSFFFLRAFRFLNASRN